LVFLLVIMAGLCRTAGAGLFTWGRGRRLNRSHFGLRDPA
jgi:hypothetical protein